MFRRLCTIVVDVTGNPPWNISYSVDGTVSTIISSDSPVIIYSTQEGTYTIPYVLDLILVVILVLVQK